MVTGLFSLPVLRVSPPSPSLSLLTLSLPLHLLTVSFPRKKPTAGQSAWPLSGNLNSKCVGNRFHVKACSDCSPGEEQEEAGRGSALREALPASQVGHWATTLQEEFFTCTVLSQTDPATTTAQCYLGLPGFRYWKPAHLQQGHLHGDHEQFICSWSLSVS